MIPFSATLRSEWTKLTTLRSVRVMTLVSVLLSVGLTALFSFAVGHSARHTPLPGDFEPISFSMVGTLVTAVFFTVIGVGAATAEYSTGMMRVTLTATPRRGRVIAAKLLCITALTLVAGTVAVVAMFLVAQHILASYGVVHAGLGDGDALRTVLMQSLLSPLLPVFGLVLGVVLRSTAGALISVLAVLFGPPLVGSVLPKGWQHPLRWFPDAASDALTTGHLPHADRGIGPWPAAAVLLGWVALFVAAGWAALERRDA